MSVSSAAGEEQGGIDWGRVLLIAIPLLWLLMFFCCPLSVC
ncbi:MAG: hypothetical protein R3E95_13480 [Thiolinea sp.]